jgi:hypothetical protein
METLKDEEKSESTILTTCGTREIKKVTYKTLKIKIEMTMNISEKRQMQM